MFTSFGTRSVKTYNAVGIETAVAGANPHQLISLLFDELQKQLLSARCSMSAGDISAKGRAIGRAVRILEEGLKAGLDIQRGGALAGNLQRLYDYCIFQVSQANLRNDTAMIDEVVQLIQPVADGWKQMGEQLATTASNVH
jgi:flagellar secretion chaperone FliS